MKTIHPFAGVQKKQSWFWWGLNLGIALAIVMWWRKENQKRIETPATKTPNLILPPEADKPAKTLAATDTTDDLQAIKGIGPKSAQALQAAGITTYAQLARLSTPEIETLLQNGGIRIVRVGDWANQAAQLHQE